MRRFGSAVLIVVAGLGCGGGDSGGPNPPPPPPPPSAPNSVNVTSNQFNPATVTIDRNEAVTWNFQTGPHNVTFEDGAGSSGDKSSGTHQRTFSNAGTYRYQCTLHSVPGNFSSGMVGSVVVNP